jgi:hypothetical protein
MEPSLDKSETQQNIGGKKGKKKLLGFLVLGGIPLLFVLYLVLGPILDILTKDISAKDMYVISEDVNVRSTSDINSLKMGSLTYGEKVLVYEIKDDWAEVLVGDRKVFLASEFLVEPEVYYTIEGIFADDRAEKLVKYSKYKMALYQYFKSKGFGSEISDDIKKKYFKTATEKEIYQLICEPKGSLYNSAVFADFDGNFSQDAAFVLKHKGSEDKFLVIFSFDKDDPLTKSKVIYEGALDESWMSIKLAKKGTSFPIEDESDKKAKLKLPVNGLLIGSNRSKSLNDPVSVFYYDGKNFIIQKLKSDKK